jgi:hypothetical protein
MHIIVEMKAVWGFLSCLHREAERGAGKWASVCREIWDPKSRHSLMSREDWSLNCTLQWRQKLKQVDSFRAQYGAAIYRARYQQQQKILKADTVSQPATIEASTVRYSGDNSWNKLRVLVPNMVLPSITHATNKSTTALTLAVCYTPCSGSSSCAKLRAPP